MATPTAKPARVHPLRGLTAGEIRLAAAILTKIQQAKSGEAPRTVRFQHITLSEPPKSLLMPYLDAESAGIESSKRPWVPRCARITWAQVHERQDCESIVSLDTELEVAHTDTKVSQHNGLDKYAPIPVKMLSFSNGTDRDEVIAATITILTDPMVLAEIKKFQLPENVTIQCDTWPFGTDLDSKEDDYKLIQAVIYARAPHNHQESNQYSFPIPISPVYDPFLKRVIRIDSCATGGKEDGLKHNTVAPEIALAHLVENEYHSELQKGGLRTDIKPLLVLQPEGPSFTVEDETRISWQKWTFRVGFNWREGMTIHDVRYDGRKLFYRLSMSEMTVPYGG
jgi:primary-amine oxidase